MHTFPVIRNFKDVEDQIDQYFYIAEKEGYKVVNYRVPCPDTFPDVTDVKTAIRRSFRGIIFDSVTGDILRRPLDKFFNLNERAETRIENLDLSKPHVIMEKLDGSLISPFRVNGKLIWGTKLGATDIGELAEEFVAKHTKYEIFAKTMLDADISLIFEFVTNRNRIVLDYPEENLILIAMRNIRDGTYIPYDKMEHIASWHDIPVVKVFKSKKLTPDFVEELRKQEGVEGIVVRFDDGLYLKCKTDWYCQLHRVKSEINNERCVVQLIIEGKIDDLKPIMLKEDVVKLEQFEKDLWHVVNDRILRIQEVIDYIKEKNMSRKDFALTFNESAWLRVIVFSLWNDIETNGNAMRFWIIEEIKNSIVKNCGKNKNYDEMKATGILNGLVDWKPVMFEEA